MGQWAGKLGGGQRVRQVWAELSGSCRADAWLWTVRSQSTPIPHAVVIGGLAVWWGLAIVLGL